jgi:hypothetical protein
MPVLEKCKFGAVAVYEFVESLFWDIFSKNTRRQNKYFKAQQLVRSEYMIKQWDTHAQDFTRDENGQYDESAIMLSPTNRTRLLLEQAFALADLSVNYLTHCVSSDDGIGEQVARDRLKNEMEELNRCIDRARKEHVLIEPYFERYPWAEIRLTS